MRWKIYWMKIWGKGNGMREKGLGLSKNMNYLITILIIISLFSCRNTTENTDSVTTRKEKVPTIIDSNVYDDIDLFNLEGVGKINRPTGYPYIKVESNSLTEKRIVYKISENDSVKKKYKLKNKHWISSYEYQNDTGYSITYEYIQSKKIIELEYLGTYKKTDYHLHSASLILPLKEIGFSYFGEKGVSINPDPSNFEIVKLNANSEYLTEYDNKDGVLKIMTNSFDKKENRNFYSDTSCYNIGNHSWVWWRYFSKEKSVKCK